MSTDTVWASSRGEWPQAPNPRPWAWQSVRRHQIRLPEQTCLPRTTPAALAPTAAPEDPPWHVLSACAETASFHQPPDSHTDMPVAHQPTSPVAVWLFVAESLRKLLSRPKKGHAWRDPGLTYQGTENYSPPQASKFFQFPIVARRRRRNFWMCTSHQSISQRKSTANEMFLTYQHTSRVYLSLREHSRACGGV